MQPTLIIFGDRTANEVLEAAEMGYSERFDRIQKVYFEQETFIRKLVPELAAAGGQVNFHVGVANATVKHEINRHCLEANWQPFSIVHPTASVAPSANLGVGVFVGALAVVSSQARVGDYSIVHIHATVGHDVAIGEYCAILPGARLSGLASIGDRALIGSNAFVAAGIKIGEDCQVDALTYVRHDLPAGHLISVRSNDRPLKRVDIRTSSHTR